MRPLQQVLASLCLLFVLCSNASSATHQWRRMVLVATIETDIPPLTLAELRRAYLGVTVRKGGYDIIPASNMTDPLLYEVFLQKIIFMSARNYERQLLTRALKWGGRRPAKYSNLALLAGALKQHPGAITYMWATAVEAVPGTKVVQELWAGPVN